MQQKIALAESQKPLGEQLREIMEGKIEKLARLLDVQSVDEF